MRRPRLPGKEGKTILNRPVFGILSPLALHTHCLPPGSLRAEKFSQMLSVNEELQTRLAQGRSGPSRTAAGPRVSSELLLSPRSEAAGVRAWLRAKGFSAE